MASATYTDVIGEYAAAFRQAERLRTGHEPAWLGQKRAAAMAHLEQHGFPTTDDEDWRRTNVAPLVRRTFLAPVEREFPSPAALSLPAWSGPRLVFVDGRFARNLSCLEGLPPGVELASLADRIEHQPGSLEAHLARHSDQPADAFEALNTALFSDGAWIRVGRNVVVPAPIQILYASCEAIDPTLIVPRNLFVAEAGSQVTIIERYLACGDGARLVASVTEAVVEENARIDHYLVEEESPEAFQISRLAVRMARDARFEAHSVLLGGALVRSSVHPVLAGSGCDCLVNGLYLAEGRQHFDHRMRVEHVGPHGSSHQFFKGILDGQSRGVFAGRIVVHPGAQRTDAKQSNMNLLLSEDAEADSMPQLEIYADDVKCTHGATTGHIADEALFYLRSRGIDERSARSLLVYGFAADSLSRMNCEPIRKELTRELARRLGQNQILEPMTR